MTPIQFVGLALAILVLDSVSSHRIRAEVANSPWQRHTIDASSRGADGVRLADLDGDGLLDIATGWEEGGVVRVCINPGPKRASLPWPSVTVGKGAKPEDAVMADLNSDGIMEVISCHEGSFQRVLIHFFNAIQSDRVVSRSDFLNPGNWSTVEITETVNRTRWMYAAPMQIDHRHGVDLVVGSKAPNAVVGWLQSPQDPLNGAAWKFHPIEPAGWIMTLDVISTAPPAIAVTDRKGQRRAAYRLDLVDQDDPEKASNWKRTNLGGQDMELMFAALVSSGDESSSGNDMLLAASRDGRWLAMPTDRTRMMKGNTFANPLGIRSGKAIAATSYDADHVLLAHTTNTANDNKAHEIPGVAWAIVPRKTLTGDPGTAKNIDWRAMSDTTGVKFDRGEWLDVDGDSDKDFITCEERDNLGVFWYENPGH